MEKFPFTFTEAARKDFPRIAAFFKAHKYGLTKEAYLIWKYLENPFGLGRLFIILDCKNEIQGIIGYIPRPIYGKNSGKTMVMEAIDLYFTPQIRGNKIFPAFKKFAMNHLKDILIGFPNKSTEKIIIEVGWEHVAPIDTWFFPIIKNICKKKKMPVYISYFCGVIDFLYNHLFFVNKSNLIELKPVNNFCTDFDIHTKNIRPGHSAKYLNWRYAHNPTQQYKLFEFVFNRKIIGYVILKEVNKSVVIFDLFFVEKERYSFRKVVDYCRNYGYEKIIIKSVGLKFWKYGFIKFSSDISLISFNLPNDKWILMIGDSDW